MENIARGCFISLQPCLHACSLFSSFHLFHLISHLYSAPLRVPLPLRLCLPTISPTSCPLCINFWEHFFPNLRLQCDKSARMVSLLPPPSSPPRSLSNPGGPKRTRQHCHFGPALREDEAGKVKSYRESERGAGRAQHGGGDKSFLWGVL